MRYWTRPQWKANPPKSSPVVMPKPVDVIYVHHDAGAFMSDPVSTIQGIQRLHQAGDYNDIAYHEWVSYTGDVFEGRGFGVKDGATGCQGGKSLSICVQGNFDNVIPTRVQIDAIVARIVAAAQEGRLSPGFKILAHQQAPPCWKNGGNTNATACCGKHLLAELPTIRARVASALNPPPLPDPTPSPTPTPSPEDDMAPFYVRYDLHSSQSPAVWLVDWTGHKSPVHSPDTLKALEAQDLIVKTVDLSNSKNASESFLSAMHK